MAQNTGLKTKTKSLQQSLFHHPSNILDDNSYNDGSNDIELFIASRLIDKAQFRSFNSSTLKQHRQDYPHIKCDLIIFHNNNAHPSNNDDNHGGAFSHDEIDLFTRDDKSETIFLEINEEEEKFYKIS